MTLSSLSARPTIYGIGYSGRTLDDIQRIINELDAYLVDIRFAPYSRNPTFRKANLEKALGERYIYLQALGNRNYQGGPIELVDYDAGKFTLETLDKPALLMCMCKNPATCHRTVVLRRLSQDGFNTQEWNENGTQQLSLW
jgi:uncharacterized protein (DUF488 family)